MNAPAKVLRVAIPHRVHTLDPRESRDSITSLALHQVFETPYAVASGEGPPEPVLFTGPLEPEGPLTASAAVRPGVAFADGTPLDAAQLAASLAKVAALADDARVEARGDRVVFHFTEPRPRFDLALTLMHAGVLLARGDSLHGTGPYQPAPGATLESLRLVRNPHHRQPAAIDEIVFTVYPPDRDGRPEALMRALERGEVDFTNALARGDVGSLQGVRKAFQPSSSTAILFFNTERPELRDPAVRRAMAMAIDRRRLTEVSYSNVLAFTATNLLPPMMGTGRDNVPYDLGKARSLMAASGAKPRGLRLLLTWAPRPYLPNPQPVGELIARQLAELGIDVEIEVPRASDDYFRRQKSGDYDMILGGWIADTPDPADFLEAILRSDRVPRADGKSVDACNLARIRSRALDAAVDRFRLEPSADNRAAVMRALSDEMPLLPLMYGSTVIVHSWRVKNVEISALGLPSFGRFDLAPR